MPERVLAGIPDGVASASGTVELPSPGPGGGLDGRSTQWTTSDESAETCVTSAPGTKAGPVTFSSGTQKTHVQQTHVQ